MRLLGYIDKADSEQKINYYRTDLQGMIYYQWLPWQGLSKAKFVKEQD